MNFDETIKQIALQNYMSEKEAYWEMQKAINIAFLCRTPENQYLWGKFSNPKKPPSVEEFVLILAGEVGNNIF